MARTKRGRLPTREKEGLGTRLHSFYYRRIGKWGHFSVFQQNKDISKSCYAMDKLKGHNQIFLTEVEHQSDGKMLCKSEGR